MIPETTVQRNNGTPAGLVDQLSSASRMATQLARRRGMGADAADFASWVVVRLLDNDRKILRCYRGESSMRTYLAAVIANLFRDYLDKQRGKWRASAAARRIGALGVALERLIYRDGVTLQQACEHLRTAGYPEVTSRAAAQLLARLPRRYPRSFEGPAALAALADERAADDRLWRAEQDWYLERARQALDEALGALPPEDRLVVELRYQEGLTVAQIAHVLGLKKKGLYRRCERILARLKASERLAALHSDR